MVERKGNIPNRTFGELTGGNDDTHPSPCGYPDVLPCICPPGGLAEAGELTALRAAVGLHRPRLFDKYGQPTDTAADAKWIRCNECRESVTEQGCNTWRTAHPARTN